VYVSGLGVKSNSFCGGTIVSKRFVLTAAHCMDEVNLEHAGVHVGQHRHHMGGSHYHITDVFDHPKLDRAKKLNDVAMLRLKKKIVFSAHVARVCLPKGPQDSPKSGMRAVSTGWGYLDNKQNIPETLQFVGLDIVSLKECKNRLLAFKVSMGGQKLERLVICTYSYQGRSATGD
jgi:secreted trypsin-like serine protease